MTITTPLNAAPIVAPGQLIDTPSLVVDETILRQNIAEMASLAKSMGVALRPHIKTHKTPEIARLQMAAGAIGITCAKLGEAEVMADGGIEDILIAYPTVGDMKIKRLLALMERARMILAVDSREAAMALSEAMTRNERVLDVYVEVNTGQDRSGSLFGDDTVALAVEIARLSGLRLTGIMSHEGQANTQGPDLIESVAVEAGHRLVATAEKIRALGIELPVVSVGSTPAAAYTPTVSGITEMRPGTYVFKDTTAFRYGIYGPDRCAARFYATVASHPGSDRYIVDAGSKTLALDKSYGHPGHGYIVGHPTAIIDRLSEEHGVVIVPEGDPGFAIGETVEIIPNHVCPTVNLMDEIVIVRDGRVIDRWKIAARGKVR